MQIQPGSECWIRFIRPRVFKQTSVRLTANICVFLLWIDEYLDPTNTHTLISRPTKRVLLGVPRRVHVFTRHWPVAGTVGKTIILGFTAGQRTALNVWWTGQKCHETESHPVEVMRCPKVKPGRHSALVQRLVPRRRPRPPSDRSVRMCTRSEC